ncbi:L-serine ammonia-lyase, iron-sulfur-dependent, subunit alpha [Aminiphilus sp.]|jgi:L-cysteine desulfidase|uniref:L-cysteine desulfidase family protein n=1 Tax=Aminiphilus sp. TaxID=1872488 RepID=UPI001BD117CA|nr:L-serine ammonia-lyase, iron-sulfur-dependent, subunit alpha [Aminiphilus sp.]
MQELLEILRKETKPALGCTGPVSIAFAAAAARDAVGGTPQRATVRMDKDSYKNSLRVGIPGTDHMGIDISVALGVVAGDPAAGLEVLNKVTPEEEKNALAFVKHVDVDIFWEYEGVGLRIEAEVETDKGIGRAIVAKTHTNVVYLEANGAILLDNRASLEGTSFDYSKDAILGYTLKDLYRFAETVPLADIDFLKSGIAMNRKLAEAGLAGGVGAGFGPAYRKWENGNLMLKVKSYTAAASDARMGGLGLPAMSCATSGNVGITAMLPLVVAGEEFGVNEEVTLRAIALSYLLTILMKSRIGRLSAICACAMAAGIGVAAGTSMLLGGDVACADRAIQNMTGSLTGIVCDGAKYGCALKLSAAAGMAIESALLARDGYVVPRGDGLVCGNADESMAAIGRTAQEGMTPAATVMARIIIERENAAKALE